MRRVRLIYLNSARDWGGAENWSLELCTGLADRGHQVTFVCHPASELRRRLDGDPRLKLAPVRIRGELDPLRVVQLARLFRRADPHLLIAYRTKDVKLSAAAAWLAGGIPLVHAHKAPHQLRSSAVYRFFWRGVRALAVPSQAMRALLLEKTPWLAGKPIRVIPNGVDTTRYRPRPELREAIRDELGAPRDVFLISYHGRVEERKNVDLLIRGVAQACASVPVHAVIIGEGPKADELRELATSLGAPATFTGFRTDVARLLSAADAAVHFSTAEGMPNSVLEAMACGLPVIASAATSHAEQIDDGVHGLLVPLGQVERVAEAILKLARAPEVRLRMGRAAKERAAEEFSRDRMIERYEAFFREFARVTKELEPASPRSAARL